MLCRMNRSLLFCLILMTMTLLLAGVAFSDDTYGGPENLTYITEEYYPSSYIENSHLTGSSVEILREMWRRMHIAEQPIEILPWARGYDMLCNNENTVLFSMSRTPERKPLFKWVGPIDNVRFVLFGSATQMQLAMPDDLKGKTIGVVRDDVADQILTKLATGAKLDRTASVEINLRKLLDGRVDYIAHEEMSMMLLLRRLDVPMHELHAISVLSRNPVFFALNPSVPDSTVSRMQKALDSMKADHTHERILKRFKK